MIVDALLGEGHCQGSLLVAILLDLGSLVLEPDLELRLLQAELRAEVLPPLLGQVLVGKELPLQPLDLLRVEGRPRLLLRAGAARALGLGLPLGGALPLGAASGGSVRVSGGEHPGGDGGEAGGGEAGGVGRVGQIHRHLRLRLDHGLHRGHGGHRGGGGVVVAAEVRAKDVLDGEAEAAGAAGAGVVRGEGGVGVRGSTAALGHQVLLPLLLQLPVADEGVHGDGGRGCAGCEM